VIISERVAQRLWPSENAVGRRIILWKGQSESVAEVIGVAGDMRDWDLADSPTLAVYMPFNGGGMSTANYIVHTTSAPTTLIPLVRSIMREVSPTTPVAGVRTLDTLVGESVASRRFTMLLLASLAAVAVLLALAGVYGVLSYSVSRRRTEIGMRMALGESGPGIFRLVLGEGMVLVAVGAGLGLGGALAMGRVLQSQLYDVRATDPRLLMMASAVLVLVAALACVLPARRASQVSPVVALTDQ
jgi:putative ABC transport system permease protein